ncbi:MAG: hypothetical protein ACJA13_003499 [Paraglaciecola sp.]|jgi:hypothetical protein
MWLSVLVNEYGITVRFDNGETGGAAGVLINLGDKFDALGFTFYLQLAHVHQGSNVLC